MIEPNWVTIKIYPPSLISIFFKKAFFSLTLLFFFNINAKTQNLDLAWAKGMGAISNDQANAITVDATGNSYTTGQFTGTVDFDPGAGISNLTSAGASDIFICKFDALGNFIWVKQMGGGLQDFGTAITLDVGGNIYTTGGFQSVADFDPGAGAYNISSFGSTDIFVSKLDPNGNFIWAKQMGGSSSDDGNAIGIDPAGNVCSTGQFSGSADFNPGSGTYNFTVVGNVDLYVSKLDGDGNFLWAVQVGGDAGEIGFGICLDNNGNVYTTGILDSELTGADFDPGPGVLKLYGVGAFVYKLDGAGNLVWAKALRASPSVNLTRTIGYSINLDANGNVYTTGNFLNNADFDPGPGVYNLTTLTNVVDVYISKLNSAGDFVWAKQFSASTTGWVNNGTSIAIGVGGSVYLTGLFNGTMDFDPGPGTKNLTPAGSSDVFVSTLDNAGNFISAKQIGGVDFDRASSIKVDISGNIYLAGAFNQTADFDPCPGTYNLSSTGGYDIFIAKFAPPSVTITASSIAICSGTSVTFTATPTNGGLAPSYQWQLNGINVGGNSLTYVNNSFANGDKINCIMNTVTSCSSTPFVYSDTITMIVKPVPVISINTTNPIISLGSSIQLNPTVTGNIASYLWTPSTGLNNPLILNPIASPITTTIYNLNVVATNSCFADKKLTVTVIKDIYIPNSFTPNGDTKNDVFRIPPVISLNVQYFIIYDRYGNEIFKTSDINTGWNGTYKGVKSPNGAYTYVIKGSDSKGEIFLNGTVLLIR